MIKVGGNLKMIFLSYSSKNSQIAEEIYNLFLNKELDVWFAPESIEEGNDYGESIINGIENCKIFVLLLSEDSNKSNHVLTEVEIAFKNKKIIYPLRIENVLPSKSLEYRIANKQWIDIFQDIDKNINRFISTIKQKYYLIEEDTKQEDIKQEDTKYSVVIKPKNITKYLDQAIKIDYQHYNEEQTGILETCIKWYEANNDIYTFIIDNNDNVVAYFNAMLLEEEIFEKLKKGTFFDNNITPDSIITPFLPGTYRLYFCSIAIDKNHNNNKIEIFSLLYKSFFHKLREWADNDFYIEEIIADAITSDGKNISQSFGLTKIKETDHSSTLYYAKMLPPNFKGSKDAQLVFNKYKNYYENFNL